MSDLTESVVRYLADGHRLLALRGKRPHTGWHENWSWEKSIHGNVPRELVESCFDDPTVTGVAILIPEHVLVADIDTEAAAELFRDLAGNPVGTAIARTTKGLHVWYMAPGAKGSRWLGDRALLFKGFGGYVAVEPSKHYTDDTLTTQDGSYSWVLDISNGIDWLPEGIEAMFKAQDLMNPPGIEADHDMVAFQLQFEDGHWAGAYPTWQLDGLAHAIETAQDGNQNNVLSWASMVAQEEGVPYDVAMDRLLAAALRGNHPRKRAVDTIRGVYKRRGAI